MLQSKCPLFRTILCLNLNRDHIIIPHSCVCIEPFEPLCGLWMDGGKIQLLLYNSYHLLYINIQQAGYPLFKLVSLPIYVTAIHLRPVGTSPPGNRRWFCDNEMRWSDYSGIVLSCCEECYLSRCSCCYRRWDPDRVGEGRYCQWYLEVWYLRQGIPCEGCRCYHIADLIA